MSKKGSIKDFFSVFFLVSYFFLVSTVNLLDLRMEVLLNIRSLNERLNSFFTKGDQEYNVNKRILVQYSKKSYNIKIQEY